MGKVNKPADPARQAQLQAEMRRERELRQGSYRERALKLFSHVCARCARDLSGKRLRELTVHHRDHNHNNNPPDGSNWELLCVYCHDNEHETFRDRVLGDGPVPVSGKAPPPIANPFAGLDSLLEKKPRD